MEMKFDEGWALTIHMDPTNRIYNNGLHKMFWYTVSHTHKAVEQQVHSVASSWSDVAIMWYMTGVHCSSCNTPAPDAIHGAIDLLNWSFEHED